MQYSTHNYITYHQRPIKADSIRTFSQSELKLPQLAIVIQGPIITANEFTFETIKLYKQHFPNAIIILSTWRDEQQIALTMIDSLGILVLLNEKPNFTGVSNINMQVVSSRAGVKKANLLIMEQKLFGN